MKSKSVSTIQKYIQTLMLIIIQKNDVRIKRNALKKHGIPFTYYGISDTYIEIPLNELNIKAWTPDTPYLYTFSIDIGNDHVESYFALRTFTIEKRQQ